MHFGQGEGKWQLQGCNGGSSLLWGSRAPLSACPHVLIPHVPISPSPCPCSRPAAQVALGLHPVCTWELQCRAVQAPGAAQGGRGGCFSQHVWNSSAGEGLTSPVSQAHPWSHTAGCWRWPSLSILDPHPSHQGSPQDPRPQRDTPRALAMGLGCR